MGWQVTRDLFAAAASAATNSEVYNVQGMDNITLQLLGSPSTTTIIGSNDSGYASAIAAASWSTLTTVIGVGIVAIDPGFNWIRCVRSETTNAIIAGWQRSW